MENKEMNAKEEQSSINITIDNEYKFDEDFPIHEVEEDVLVGMDAWSSGKVNFSSFLIPASTSAFQNMKFFKNLWTNDLLLCMP